MGKSGKPTPGELRGPIVGRCNICGEVGPLTADHTPPKSCGGVTQAEVRAFYETIGEQTRSKKRPKIQRRATFRTLCRRCNSDVLGHLYDPALADVCRQVRMIANGVLALPDRTRIRIRPAAVTRSVLGHMAAQGLDRYDKGPLTEPIRDYILNPALPLPCSLRLYFWLYPYQPQIRIRDASYVEFGRIEPFTFWLLKFFPLAFLLTFDTEVTPNGSESLSFYRAVSVDELHDVPIRVRPLVPELWPEHPTDMAAVMYGHEASVVDSIQQVQRNPDKR